MRNRKLHMKINCREEGQRREKEKLIKSPWGLEPKTTCKSEVSED